MTTTNSRIITALVAVAITAIRSSSEGMSAETADVTTYVPVTPAGELLRGPWRGSGWHLAATAAMATIVTVSLLVGVWRFRQE